MKSPFRFSHSNVFVVVKSFSRLFLKSQSALEVEQTLERRLAGLFPDSQRSVYLIVLHPQDVENKKKRWCGLQVRMFFDSGPQLDETFIENKSKTVFPS
jgi:hypothetical protein